MVVYPQVLEATSRIQRERPLCSQSRAPALLALVQSAAREGREGNKCYTVCYALLLPSASSFSDRTSCRAWTTFLRLANFQHVASKVKTNVSNNQNPSQRKNPHLLNKNLAIKKSSTAQGLHFSLNSITKEQLMLNKRIEGWFFFFSFEAISSVSQISARLITVIWQFNFYFQSLTPCNTFTALYALTRYRTFTPKPLSISLLFTLSCVPPVLSFISVLSQRVMLIFQWSLRPLWTMSLGSWLLWELKAL